MQNPVRYYILTDDEQQPVVRTVPVTPPVRDAVPAVAAVETEQPSASAERRARRARVARLVRAVRRGQPVR